MFPNKLNIKETFWSCIFSKYINVLKLQLANDRLEDDYPSMLGNRAGLHPSPPPGKRKNRDFFQVHPTNQISWSLTPACRVPPAPSQTTCSKPVSPSSQRNPAPPRWIQFTASQHINLDRPFLDNCFIVRSWYRFASIGSWWAQSPSKWVSSQPSLCGASAAASRTRGRGS